MEETLKLRKMYICETIYIHDIENQKVTKKCMWFDFLAKIYSYT